MLTTRAPLTASHSFGENMCYSNAQGMWKFRLGLNAQGVPGIAPWGRLLFPMLPRTDVSLHVVVGKAVRLPHIQVCCLYIGIYIYINVCVCCLYWYVVCVYPFIYIYICACCLCPNECIGVCVYKCISITRREFDCIRPCEASDVVPRAYSFCQALHRCSLAGSTGKAILVFAYVYTTRGNLTIATLQYSICIDTSVNLTIGNLTIHRIHRQPRWTSGMLCTRRR